MNRSRPQYKKPPDLPALTGLRFFAAFFVLIAHLLSQIFHQDQTNIAVSLLNSLSGIGMPLFFVLSGFVLQYNYAGFLKNPTGRTVLKFYIVRISRLYPLFITLFAAEYISVNFVKEYELSNSVWVALSGFPYFDCSTLYEPIILYLTLTQSWVYQQFYSEVYEGYHSVIYVYGPMAPVTWSISVEWFFYLLFPLFSVLFSKISSMKVWAIALGLIVIVQFACNYAAYSSTSAIDSFAISIYGGNASLEAGLQDSFFRWIMYFFPLAQLPNFLLGALIGQLLFFKGPPRESSALRPDLMFWVAMAFTALLYLLAFSPYRISFITHLHYNALFSVPIAFIIYALTNPDTRICRFLSHRLLVKMGESSYSIYLLHTPIIVLVVLLHRYVGQTEWAFGYKVFMAVAVGVTVIVISRLTYLLIERPGQRLMRDGLLSAGNWVGRRARAIARRQG